VVERDLRRQRQRQRRFQLFAEMSLRRDAGKDVHTVLESPAAASCADFEIPIGGIFVPLPGRPRLIQRVKMRFAFASARWLALRKISP
jgi:hypothetical protein